ncbi:hypothetical protein [Noviherbaspirillum malthae]|uniref:hypothetical protein n=1 Tax=Noviherbaspirillum malthae TaxID=1260987 RepID=UPI00188EC9A0|nr:hypothetical protein [Noviherbaspirillum malthae]
MRPLLDMRIPLRLFQPEERDLAGAFLQSCRMNGEISAAFIYTQLMPALEENFGGLYVVFPNYYQADLGNIHQRYQVHSSVNGEQLAVWIKDTEIDEALTYIVDHIHLKP